MLCVNVLFIIELALLFFNFLFSFLNFGLGNGIVFSLHENNADIYIYTRYDLNLLYLL